MKFVLSDFVLPGAVLLCVAISAVLYFRLRRARKAVSSLKATAVEMKARARLVSDRSRQAIIIFDSRGLIRGVNPAAEKMCGYREVELIGQSFLRLVPESPAGGGEAEVRRKDGRRLRRRFTMGRTGNPDAPDIYLFFDENEPAAQSGAQANAECKPEPKAEGKGDSRHELVQTATDSSTSIERTAVEDVVNRIVREFEGLLTTISGYTELALHGTPPSSPIRKDLEEVAAASDAASNLARNLLAYSGRQAIPVESVDLNALVVGLEGGLREAMKTPFHVQLAQERPTLMGNGECLGKIVMILCTSAHHRVHHLGEAERASARVELRTEKRRLEQAVPVYTGKVPAGVYSVLSVSDSGRAIESATLAHLFEPLFFERDEVGVELAPLHGIVRSLGGWINVTSQASTGTTFEVLFPYAGDLQLGNAQATGSLVG